MKKLKCSICEKNKNINNFYFNKKRKYRFLYCKLCNYKKSNKFYKKIENRKKFNSYLRNYQKKNKERNFKLLISFLNKNPCVDCGEKDPVVLEFDHVKGKKKFGITLYVSLGRRWELIEEEIKKCVVRCANCHRRKTTYELGWQKSILLDKKYKKKYKKYLKKK